jgi:hypothetical protein
MNPLRRYPVLASLLRPFRLSQQKTCAATPESIQVVDRSAKVISGQPHFDIDIKRFMLYMHVVVS